MLKRFLNYLTVISVVLCLTGCLEDELNNSFGILKVGFTVYPATCYLDGEFLGDLPLPEGQGFAVDAGIYTLDVVADNCEATAQVNMIPPKISEDLRQVILAGLGDGSYAAVYYLGNDEEYVSGNNLDARGRSPVGRLSGISEDDFGVVAVLRIDSGTKRTFVGYNSEADVIWMQINLSLGCETSE